MSADRFAPTTPVVVHTDARRIDVTGADRARYLDDVTTQAFEDLAVGEVSGALYLDMHGGPLAMFDVAVLADRFALLAPAPEVVTTLTDVLGMRTFLLDATFTATDDVVAVLRGPGAEQVATDANLHTRPGTVRPAGDAGLFVIGREAGQLDLVGPKALVDDAVALLLDAGARPGGQDDLAAWRVAAGVPAWGVEVAAPHLPEEMGLLPTHVHLGKGCYPGQEAVARMWMLGRPRRRLAQITATRGVLAPGWQTGEGRRTVTVTSVAPGGTSALAFVPGDAVPGAQFNDEDDVHVEVAALVGATDTPPGHDPGVTRRRDRPRP